MPGVRLQHPMQRNVRYTVVEAANPYPVPYQCTPPPLGGCGSVHTFKTHHLNLDDTGTVIVSQTVYERIRSQLDADGFRVSNDVATPPPLVIDLSSTVPVIPIVRSPNGREPV